MKSAFQSWRAAQTHCYHCGWRMGTRWPHPGWLARLEANHIFGGAKRELTRYALWGLVMLCQWCHQEVWPRTRNRQRIVFGAALKLRNDPKHFDLDAMNKLNPGEPITLGELELELDTMEIEKCN